MTILWMLDVVRLSEQSQRRQHQQQEQHRKQINLRKDQKKIMKNYILTLNQTKNSLLYIH